MGCHVKPFPVHCGVAARSRPVSHQPLPGTNPLPGGASEPSGGRTALRYVRGGQEDYYRDGAATALAPSHHPPLVLLPPLLLVGSVLVLPGVPQPVTQQLASRVPEDARPAMPTTVGKAVAWTRETGPAVLDVAAGARGPLVLTKDGLEALRPEDGTTLWRYHRDRARYVDLVISHKVYLVVSPDRHYVAFCIEAPALGGHGPDALTTVLDTVTGETVGEWPSDNSDRVQLTDSAILVGNDAILLRDGSVLGQVWLGGTGHRGLGCRPETIQPAVVRFLP